LSPEIETKIILIISKIQKSVGRNWDIRGHRTRLKLRNGGKLITRRKNLIKTSLGAGVLVGTKDFGVLLTLYPEYDLKFRKCVGTRFHPKRKRGMNADDGN